MSETKLIILKIETSDANLTKALGRIDDAIDLMKARNNAMVTQYDIDERTFRDIVKKADKKILKRTI